ncbi:hypothetical protein ACFCZ1_21980 [Streptomyces sp. NPDC056224]|uniref:hypothetical protein n=1 Tax=Streptomyces sp. NPDC056224 TaxID=3345750 RepID=UPI0035DBD0F3
MRYTSAGLDPVAMASAGSVPDAPPGCAASPAGYGSRLVRGRLGGAGRAESSVS